MKRSLNCIAAVCIAASFPISALAESNFKTGTAPLSTTANLDFQVTIPSILYLRVGAGPSSGLDNNTTISKIDFVVPTAFVGNGSAISAQATSGDLGNGKVTAQVIGNAGPITFTAATTGALLPTGTGSAGNPDSISWSQIDIATANLPTPTAGFTTLAAPVLTDGATTTTPLNPATGSRVVQQEAQWTFSYLNSAVVAAGTYGDTSGTGAGNGRVVYTASMP